MMSAEIDTVVVLSIAVILAHDSSVVLKTVLFRWSAVLKLAVLSTSLLAVVEVAEPSVIKNPSATLSSPPNDEVATYIENPILTAGVWNTLFLSHIGFIAGTQLNFTIEALNSAGNSQKISTQSFLDTLPVVSAHEQSEIESSCKSLITEINFQNDR